jgi:hypothetical protein
LIGEITEWLGGAEIIHHDDGKQPEENNVHEMRKNRNNVHEMRKNRN